MKNIILIDSTSECTCDLVSAENDGTNSIYLEIVSDVSMNPKLYTDEGTIDISESPFRHKIPDDNLVASAVMTFRIIDDHHTGDVFTIRLPSVVHGNMSVKQVDNFNYNVICTRRTVNGLPIATRERLGGIIVGNTMNIKEDGTLDAQDAVGVEPISNLRLEEILK